MMQLPILSILNRYLLQGFVDRSADKFLYTLYWALAKLQWQLERMLLSGALLINGLRQWLVDNTLELLSFMINGIAPIAAALLLFAIAILGLQLAGSRVFKTLPQLVNPERLILMAVLSVLFLGSPDVVINALEDVRTLILSVRAGDVLDGAGIAFDIGTSGTPDEPLPTAVPDVLAVGPFAGVVDAFDLTSYYIQVDNVAVLDAATLPPDFEATWFPNGEPSNFTLSSESEREEALRLAADGNLRLFFSLLGSGAVIAEQLLYLMLQGAGVVLYLGLPLAFALSYFIFTQSLLTQYIHQFINLCIETLWSMSFAGFGIWLMVKAGGYGVMYFFCTALFVAILLYWRVLSAGLLLMRGFSLLDGSSITGGAGIKSLARMTTGVVTGGASMAAGAVMGVAERADAALRTTGQVATASGFYAAGRHSQRAAATTDSPVRRQQAIQRGQQLQAAAGYVAGRNPRIGRLIETGHELRSIARRVSGNSHATADGLDFVRVGQMQSHYKSNPWLSIGMSSGLQEAYQQMSSRGGGKMPRYVDPEAQTVTTGRASNPTRSDSQSSQTNGGRNGQATSSSSVTLRGLETAATDVGTQSPRQSVANNPTESVENQPPDDGSHLTGIHSADSPPATPVNPVPQSGAGSAETRTANPVPQAIATLADPDPAIRNQARAAIATTAGTRSARQIDALTDKYGQPAVQQTAENLTTWLTTQQQQGRSSATILQDLQQGAAWREDLPLNSAEQATVAQAIVQPIQTVNRQNLASAALDARAAGYDSDATAAWLGSSDALPEALNAQLKLLNASADELSFSQREVLAIQADVEQHGTAATRAALITQGHDPDQSALLVETLNTLPAQTVVTPDLRFVRGNVQGFEAAAGYKLSPTETGTTDMGDVRERATILAQTVSGMDSQASLGAQQIAHQTATQLTHADEAAQLQQMTQRVGSAPVQAAIQHISRRAGTLRTLEGETATAIANRFSDVNSLELRNIQTDLPNTPLTRQELQQVATATLQPEVVLSRQELATAITQNAWQPNASADTLAERLQVTDFGQQTAAVRSAATTLAASGLEAVTVQQVITDIQRDDLSQAHTRLQSTKLPQLQTEKQRTAIIATLQQLPAQTRLRRRIVIPVEQEEAETADST